MGTVVAFAGNKQGGKNTCANILHGIVLKNRGMIDDYNITNTGKLLIKSPNYGEDWGEFDITRKDDKFVQYAEKEMWPYVKIYSFADALKWICQELFEVPYECLYGTDEQKNRIIPHLLWENMPSVLADRTNLNFIEEHLGWLEMKYHKPGPMTAREFLQFFGTNIMRKIWEPVWINNTIDRITKEDSELSIIADVRFPNEVTAIKGIKGKVYWLNRKISNDSHSSENSLNVENYDHSNFNGVIENQGKGHTVQSLIYKVESLYKEVL